MMYEADADALLVARHHHMDQLAETRVWVVSDPDRDCAPRHRRTARVQRRDEAAD
jgi:hypothetical protein